MLVCCRAAAGNESDRVDAVTALKSTDGLDSRNASRQSEEDLLAKSLGALATDEKLATAAKPGLSLRFPKLRLADVEPEAFKRELRAAFAKGGLSQSSSEQIRIELREGSIIADIDAPGPVLREAAKVPVERLEVRGERPELLSLEGRSVVLQAEEPEGNGGLVGRVSRFLSRASTGFASQEAREAAEKEEAEEAPVVPPPPPPPLIDEERTYYCHRGHVMELRRPSDSSAEAVRLCQRCARACNLDTFLQCQECAVAVCPACSSEAKPPAPPPEDLGAVELVFKRPDGRQVMVTFRRGEPLGLNFNRCLPLKITEVRDPAAGLGVLPGWELLRVGTEIVAAREGETFEAAFLAFRLQTQHARNLEAVFVTQKQKERTVVFTRGLPLGFNFMRRMPIIVTQVRNPAEDLGVQEGWRLKRLGSTDFDRFYGAADFQEAWALFNREVQIEGAAQASAQTPMASPRHDKDAEAEAPPGISSISSMNVSSGGELAPEKADTPAPASARSHQSTASVNEV